MSVHAADALVEALLACASEPRKVTRYLIVMAAFEMTGVLRSLHRESTMPYATSMGKDSSTSDSEAAPDVDMARA